MLPTTQSPVRPAEASADWLRECHGFRVDSPGGRVGIVEDVCFDERGSVSALQVAAGLIGRRTLLIGVGDVARVVPDERRLRLVGHATPLASYRNEGRPSRPLL